MSDAAERLVLRALDANANRLREGLRVVEDVARFVLDDARSAAACKAMRHQATAAMRSLGLDAKLLEARDSDADVGRGTFGRSERSREDLRDVLAANLHRAQEASRVLEELGKGHSPAAAFKFKRMRYGLYTLEKGLLSGRKRRP